MKDAIQTVTSPTRTSRAPFSAAARGQENAERLRLLTNCVTEHAIIMLDREGRVMYWNAGAERLLGYQEGEISGHHFSCFFTGEDVERGVPQRELQMARTQGRAALDHWYIRRDGTRFWSSGVMTPLWDATLHGYAIVMREHTEDQLARNAQQQSAERHPKQTLTLTKLPKQTKRTRAILSQKLCTPLATMLKALQALGLYKNHPPARRRPRTLTGR